MKPFDLELAKAGNDLVTRRGHKRFFVGTCKGIRNIVVCDSAGNLTKLLPGGRYMTEPSPDDVFLMPRKRRVWTNYYDTPYHAAVWYESQEAADADKHTGRIGNKAYPVEIEE